MDGALAGLQASDNDSFSNAAGGLQLGSGLLEKGGRVVLLSDGEENVGDLLLQGQRLKERGIAVDVLPLPRDEQPDAAIDALDVPVALKQGERFTFELSVTSTFAGEAELRLYEDNTEKARQPIVLERGENRFALQSVAAEPGFHRYRAELYANGDRRSENNTAYAFRRIDGPPSVLVVEGAAGSSGNIRSALEASLFPYEVLQPERLSLELADYARYDSIVLNYVPATADGRVDSVADRYCAAAHIDSLGQAGRLACRPAARPARGRLASDPRRRRASATAAALATTGRRPPPRRCARTTLPAAPKPQSGLRGLQRRVQPPAPHPCQPPHPRPRSRRRRRKTTALRRLRQNKPAAGGQKPPPPVALRRRRAPLDMGSPRRYNACVCVSQAW